jgi:hypothetical protein
MRKFFTRRRLVWFGAVIAIFLAAIVVAAHLISRRVEPYLREQTIAYLQEKYKAEVEIGGFRVSMPVQNPVAIVLAGGQGAHVRAGVEGIVVRRPGHESYPPFMAIRELTFRVHVPELWQRPLSVDHLRLAGLEIHIPPKVEREPAVPERQPGTPASPKPAGKPAAIIDVVDADGAVLVVHPKDSSKEPLRFDMERLRLESAGPGIAMRYDTVLRNPKPPGVVDCQGSFGPFNVDSPGDSPLNGEYTFTNADLGDFKGIAGILESRGRFHGRLSEITVDGEASVPRFRLTRSGNPVPLRTEFHTIVDGTNGNTLLQPVRARLGNSHFVVRGGVVRNRGENGKTVALDVFSERGSLDDYLTLVLKGDKRPLTGGVGMKVKIEVPPGEGHYADRLVVAGDFGLTNARFTSPATQEKIDDLSRRAQGKPRSTKIDNVPSEFAGNLLLKNGVLRLSGLTFDITGADVLLNGTYNLDTEALDFRGVARTRARVSQMVKSRWKGLLLKPVDPFFAKDGAGAVFKIAITGTREKPDFGLDR